MVLPLLGVTVSRLSPAASWARTSCVLSSGGCCGSGDELEVGRQQSPGPPCCREAGTSIVGLEGLVGSVAWRGGQLLSRPPRPWRSGLPGILRRPTLSCDRLLGSQGSFLLQLLNGRSPGLACLLFPGLPPGCLFLLVQVQEGPLAWPLPLLLPLGLKQVLQAGSSHSAPLHLATVPVLDGDSGLVHLVDKPLSLLLCHLLPPGQARGAPSIVPG